MENSLKTVNLDFGSEDRSSCAQHTLLLKYRYCNSIPTAKHVPLLNQFILKRYFWKTWTSPQTEDKLLWTCNTTKKRCVMNNYEYRESLEVHWSAPLPPKRKALLNFSKFTRTDTCHQGIIVDISLLLLVKQWTHQKRRCLREKKTSCSSFNIYLNSSVCNYHEILINLTFWLPFVKNEWFLLSLGWCDISRVSNSYGILQNPCLTLHQLHMSKLWEISELKFKKRS